MSKYDEIPFQYRQGDVLLVKVGRRPAGLEGVAPDDRGRVVLAEGEQTGHAHVLVARTYRSVGRDARSGDLFVRIGAGARLLHEEHGSIPLPAGSYRIIRQKEYAPGDIRNVAD